MADPATFEDHQRLTIQNTHLDGEGIGNVHMLLPCPFCAAPGFMDCEVLASRETMAKGATCEHCGRSMKMIFKTTRDTTQFEMVQTGGPDPAPYLPPLRRSK